MAAISPAVTWITCTIVGAALVTDLVNSAPEVMVTRDALPDVKALVSFLTARDMRPDALAHDQRPTPEDLASVHALRQTLREIVESPDETRAVTMASQLTARGGMRLVLAPDTSGRWQWHLGARPGASLAEELALRCGTALLSVIRTLGHDRFRPCASPACNGVFIDTSRAGRRRYCEPEICGNRINVANHRARRRAASLSSGDG